MPAWITSLLRDEMPVPMASAASATTTSCPACAAARATARPITPAPTTRTCISRAQNQKGGHWAALRVAIQCRSLGGDTNLRCGGADVRVDVLLEFLEVCLEHADELACRLVELGLVLPGFDRVEQVRLDARDRGRHAE